MHRNRPTQGERARCAAHEETTKRLRWYICRGNQAQRQSCDRQCPRCDAALSLRSVISHTAPCSPRVRTTHAAFGALRNACHSATVFWLVRRMSNVPVFGMSMLMEGWLSLAPGQSAGVPRFFWRSFGWSKFFLSKHRHNGFSDSLACSCWIATTLFYLQKERRMSLQPVMASSLAQRQKRSNRMMNPRRHTTILYILFLVLFLEPLVLETAAAGPSFVLLQPQTCKKKCAQESSRQSCSLTRLIQHKDSAN